MTRLVVCAVSTFIALCHSSFGQMLDPFQLAGSPFPNSALGFLPITLGDQDRVSFTSALNWQTPTNYLPPFNPVAPQQRNVTLPSGKEISSANTPQLSITDRIYVGGEIGFTYGRSTGKNGFEYEQGYLIGELGNEWFHLTIGMSREHVNWKGQGR